MYLEMASIVIMPKLGATMDEGKIIRWIAREGDIVVKGTPLLEVESDKATLEVEASSAGTLLKILHPDGDIPVLQPIGIIGAPGEDISGMTGQYDHAAQFDIKPEEGRNENRAADYIPIVGKTVRSTPAAKHAAKLHNVDLSRVVPNENGVITGVEMEQYIKTPMVKATPVAACVAQMNNIPLDGVAYDGKKIYKADVLSYMDMHGKESQTELKTQKMGNIRRIVAERMTSTWQTVPMASNAIEVNASCAIELCEILNRKFSIDSIKINITDILIKVLASAVSQNPEMNVWLDGDTIVYRNEINVGIAVSLKNGLVVPVIRNADRKGLLQINAEKRVLASRAKEGKLDIDEMNGGSITLTNMGSYGEGIFFPIINSPEICIVGTGKVMKKPVVVNDEIVIRPMMWVTLTFDHRVLDGVPAAKLLKEIKDMIETPELLMC
jgi:pyruvate dehydrogenase E2 component (dihydrolipoamide acetyltransferase)